MCKIGFDLHFDETPLFLQVARYLRDRYSIQVSGATLGERWKRELAECDVTVMNIADFIEANWQALDTSFRSLRRIETEYAIPNLASFIHADRFISNEYDYETALKYLLGHFLFFEKYFDELQPDAYITPGVAFLTHLVSLSVAGKRGIPHLSLVPIRSSEARFVAFHNARDAWDSVNEVYESLKKRPLTEEERQYAGNYLAEFRQKGSKPFYMQFARQAFNVRWEFIEEFTIRMRRYYFEGWRKCKYDYITKHPCWYALRDGKRIVLSQIFKHLNIFDSVDGERPFLFFPLHLEPEASTLILAPYYVNQIATIENIAKAIPSGALLYVKEHISSFGRRPLSYYRRIKRISNVRLLSPFEDSHRLIRNALASIVLSSTVGWEALLYGKPVIALGDAFYNCSGLTYTAKHVGDIPALTERYVLNHRPDEESLLRFVVALRTGSHPGLFDVPHMHADNKIMNQKNVEMVSEGIWAEVKRRKDHGIRAEMPRT